MSAPANRRSFLRGLTTLPLIGGSVALIGAPSAVAGTVTPGMIGTYIAWLDAELRYIQWGVNARGFIPALNPGFCFHEADGHPAIAARQAIERAPVVLSTVGCRLTCPEAEQQGQVYSYDKWLEAVRCA